MTVKVTEGIGAPLTAVWEIVGNFGGLARWHPLVKGCELSGAGVGAIRRVLFQDWHAEECLDAFDDDEHQLIYRVTASSKAELIGVCGKIQLLALENGNTTIEWSAWVEADRPDVADMEQFLASHYPTRISHLRDALEKQ